MSTQNMDGTGSASAVSLQPANTPSDTATDVDKRKKPIAYGSKEWRAQKGKEMKAYVDSFITPPPTLGVSTWRQEAAATLETLLSQVTLPDGVIDFRNLSTLSDNAFADLISYVEKVKAAQAAQAKIITEGDPGKYIWNLPPHQWSLPLLASTDENFMLQSSRSAPQDQYRRGRIWFKASDSNIKFTADSNAANKVGAKIAEDAYARLYGFQFLWNPSSVQSATAVQMDAAPQMGDRFLGGAGFFPGTQTFSLNLRIDRINDFACAASAFKRNGDLSGIGASVTKALVAPFKSYYTPSLGTAANVNVSGVSVEDKLIDLFSRGTLADLEFLYRAVNGQGPGNGTKWTNGRGIQTADIGFLMPTLLNIDLGPMSYAGYITQMSISHTYFTPDMVPLQTDVQLAINVLATAGFNGKTGA